MKTNNAVLMQRARESLMGKWGLAIGGFVVYMLIVCAVQSLRGIGAIISLIITGPMSVGLAMFTLSLSRKKEARLSQIFEGFNKFSTSFVAYLLIAVFTLLWVLLLIVPGIIAAISYSQTFFILADDNSISAREAIRKSKKIMYGYKWKYFCLGLRFIGWFLLSVLTLGIGFLWLFPYIQVSMAKFYDELSANNTAPSES